MSANSASRHEGSIELIVPLHNRHAATVRTMATSIGADCGFSIDEIDDFKLAINEVFSMMAERHQGQRVCISFVVDESGVVVHLAPDVVPIAVEPDQLAINILRSVVDTFEFTDDGVSLTKRASESARG